MYCPYCNAVDTKVIDSRLAAHGAQVRRRRQCVSCGERFTTFEVVEVVMPASLNPTDVASLMTTKNYVVRYPYPCKNALLA